jgi:two-component system OmpR family response regulator
MKVLVVEDDNDAAGFLSRGLREAGYAVELAQDGVEGLELASDNRFDAIIVDRVLPKLDGLLMVETLRRSGREVPVLFVSALSEIEERIKGLKAGGDDYIPKPYSLGEVLARLEAVLRRRQKGGLAAVLRVGEVELDRMSRSVRRAGKPISLQPREFRLLEYLMRHAGQVVTRTTLLESVWDFHFDPQTNVVDVHISRLRQKIDKNFDRPMIRTVRGAGYMIRAAE